LSLGCLSWPRSKAAQMSSPVVINHGAKTSFGATILDPKASRAH
jgi:hypothetical protein